MSSMADGTNKIGVPFCQLHLDNQQAYATPVFENQDALDLFKKEHPGLFKRCSAGQNNSVFAAAKNRRG